MADTNSSLISSSSTSLVIQIPSSIPTIPVKLNGRNYLYWKGVMTPLLASYGLLDHVEGLGSDWESILLSQSERMLTMSTDELQSLLVGHEERRLYAQGPQTNPSANAPLLGFLGAGPTEVLYTNEWKGGNNDKNSGKNYGDKKIPDNKGGLGDFVDRS
ncbi:hypothetical protein CRG98_019063 [Punica granatum]|uniref:Retrotransposon Copia-like N-terminal domain-containing protein n=1 Tax=Punica granatum TaxID=22663 RepID=A0A2I0JWA2_PUNGR|nr:hypothetical protein CRG98_019063 [Punica granatum]